MANTNFSKGFVDSLFSLTVRIEELQLVYRRETLEEFRGFWLCGWGRTGPSSLSVSEALHQWGCHCSMGLAMVIRRCCCSCRHTEGTLTMQGRRGGTKERQRVPLQGHAIYQPRFRVPRSEADVTQRDGIDSNPPQRSPLRCEVVAVHLYRQWYARRRHVLRADHCPLYCHWPKAAGRCRQASEC